MAFRAALYIRLSREDGDREESDSVANQRKMLMSYVEQREELSLGEIYVDDGCSGTNFERPAFRRMLEDIEAGQINCVIVKDLSRFGRDYIDTGRYLERYFPEKGVRFIAVSDGIDSLKQTYDMLLPIKNIFNEQYARDISRKIQATVKTKQETGEFIGAFPSYGYRKDPENKNHLLIDPPAAEVVRRIFALYLGGRGKQEIAEILNREGVLCPSAYKEAEGMRYVNPHGGAGGLWTYSTVNNILHREMYAGNMVQGTKHQKMRGRQRRVDPRKWVIVENTHEAVVDRETWEKVQELLKKHSRRPGHPQKENCFAGFLTCADCGGNMVRNTWRRSDGSRAAVFYCGNYKRYGRQTCTAHAVPEEILEQAVLGDLQKIFEVQGKLEDLLPEETDPGRSRVREEKKCRAELNRLRTMQKAVYEDYREGLLTREEFLAYRLDYRRREDVCRRKLRVQEAEREAEGRSGKAVPGRLEKLDRETVAEMVSGITVYGDRRIRICYKFSGECDGLFDVRCFAQPASGPWGQRSGKSGGQPDRGKRSESGNCPEAEEPAGKEGDHGGDDPGDRRGTVRGKRAE